jgi:shikimate kinase
VLSNNDPTKHLSSGGGASNEVQHIIGQNFFLKSDINFIHQLFYQTEFKPISQRQFETSEVKRILNRRHVIIRREKRTK